MLVHIYLTHIKKIYNHKNKLVLHKIWLLFLMLFIASCNNMEKELSRVISCNTKDGFVPSARAYRIYNTFYQNDSLYILHGEGTDVYSLSIKCEDKRRKLRSKCTRESCEQFVYSFDLSIKVIASKGIDDFLTFKLKRNDTTLWSCSDENYDLYFGNSYFIVNENLVLMSAFYKDKLFDELEGDVVILLDNHCRYTLIDSITRYTYFHSPYKNKVRMIKGFDNKKDRSYALLFDKQGLIKKIPAPNFKYNYNSGFFYSDSVLLSVTGGYNDRNVKIQKYQIINDTLRFVEYLPYEVYFDESVNNVKDYIFPCGENACLYRDDKMEVEKIKYK